MSLIEQLQHDKQSLEAEVQQHVNALRQLDQQRELEVTNIHRVNGALAYITSKLTQPEPPVSAALEPQTE